VRPARVEVSPISERSKNQKTVAGQMSRRHGSHVVATCRRKVRRWDIRVTNARRLFDVVRHDLSYFLLPGDVKELGFERPRRSQLPNGIRIDPRSLSLKPLLEGLDVFFRDSICLHELGDALQARRLVGSAFDGF